jgi:hypothetical protein
MRRFLGIICALFPGTGLLRAADTPLAAADWAIEAQFPVPPSTDVVLTPSPQGDVQARRYFAEEGGEHFLLARFTYPLALLPGAEPVLYAKSESGLLHSRPGEIRQQEPYQFGPYAGERLVLAQHPENTVREVRLVVIGSCLYVFSAEWPEQGPGAERAAHFLNGIRLRPDCTDARVMQQKDRWRELDAGGFRLRYDAGQWYRDPSDREPGVFNFLRPDRRAEAQFIAEAQPVEGGDIEAAVLKTAREGAETMEIKKHGTKFRGAVLVQELQFTARVEGVTYVNHGYFYSGPEGAVQLRGWAPEKSYGDVADDITELLDGLTVAPAVK